jgi:hypothetical protein
VDAARDASATNMPPPPPLEALNTFSENLRNRGTVEGKKYSLGPIF